MHSDRPEKWEHFCTCSGISLAGYISKFIHALNCPLRIHGVKNWAKVDFVYENPNNRS